MIHEIHDALFDLPLQDYILTFDDGLYSQYHHFDKFAAIDTKKIFFISTGVICDCVQSTATIPSKVAHAKAYVGNRENFMTLPQILELRAQPNVEIGGHGHHHIDLSRIPTLSEQLKAINRDTKQMLAWFSFHFGEHPTSFCFPYNNDLRGIYKAALSKYGFTDFYGKERVDGGTLPY